LYYEVNQKFAQYEPLSQMFGNGSTAVKKHSKKKALEGDSSESNLESDVRSLGNVQLAILTGQFTRDETSGIDMLIVGDINKTKLDNFISDLELVEKKEIRYVVFSESDLKYRRQIHDRFTVTVLGSKIQPIIDRDQLLAE